MTVQSGRCSPSKSPTSSSGAGVEHGTCQSQKGGGRTRWYHRLLWICGSAVHWAAASACCKDAVLTGASGPAFVKGGGHWEGHSAGQNCMILTRLCKSGCLTGQCAPQSGSEPAASLGWVNRDVRPLAAPLRPSPASQQRRRASMERSINRGQGVPRGLPTRVTEQTEAWSVQRASHTRGTSQI